MTNRHSLGVLNALYEYDSYLDSIKTVADMGCGTGEDIVWWATLTTRDDPPEPHNYRCFAVDRDAGALSQIPNLPNIAKINKDFTKQSVLPIKVDFMWAHDSLQYSLNPVDTLRLWNEQMNVNGMLVICVRQSAGVEYDKFYSNTEDFCFNNFTATNLMYMLAVNGFDCRDAYLLKRFNDPWLHIAVYKSNHAPMDPTTTTWHHLASKGLLHPTVEASVQVYGHLRQQDILMPWLDQENYFIDWIVKPTEIPAEAGEAVIAGVFNETNVSENQTLIQAGPTVFETRLLKPIGSIQPDKKPHYVK